MVKVSLGGVDMWRFRPWQLAGCWNVAAHKIKAVSCLLDYYMDSVV